MAYYEEFQKILADVRRTPEGEEQTKLWVIEPTLQALGYVAHDFVREEKNEADQRPDYSVLFDSDRKWLLEAKPWSADLTDEHVAQAMRYTGAEERRVRWVVLTNGREWRLYDAEQSFRSDQLAIRATTDDADAMEALLDALCKERVLGGGTEAAVRAFRLRHYLRDALRDEHGGVIKAVRSIAKSQPGLASVTVSEVARAIRELMTQSSPPSSEPEPQSDVEVMTTPETAKAAEGWYALNDPALKPTGIKITSVRFQNETVPLRHWSDLWLKRHHEARKRPRIGVW